MLNDQELLKAVRDATQEEFEVYGELGRDHSGRVALLALERAADALVVLVVSAQIGDDQNAELSVDVKTELDSRVPDAGTLCPKCSTKVRPWGRFCQNCGQDVSGGGNSGGSDADTAEMREAVVEAIADDYDYLGDMRRKEGGGRVYFARERASGRIAALRLNKSKDSNEFELGETVILRRNARPNQMTVAVTQLLRRLDPDEREPSQGAPSMPAADFEANMLMPKPRRSEPHAPPASAPSAPWPAAAPRPASPASVAPGREPSPSDPPAVGAAPSRPSVPPPPVRAADGFRVKKFLRENSQIFVGAGIGLMLVALAWLAMNG